MKWKISLLSKVFVGISHELHIPSLNLGSAIYLGLLFTSLKTSTAVLNALLKGDI